MKAFNFKSMAAVLLLSAGALSASAETQLPENLYLIGSATAAAWNCDAPLQMEKVNDYEFTYTGYLTEGEFKFPWVKGGAMWTSETYMAFEENTPVGKAGVKDSEAYLTHNGQPDSKWVITDPGKYKLTLKIDKADTAFGTLDAEYLGALPAAVYMLGQATGAWDSNASTPIYEDNGKFTWTGDLFYYGDDKQFKFALSRGEWNKVTFLVPTEVNYNDNVLKIEPGTYSYQESAETSEGALKDWFWGINEGKSGQYEVTIDTTAKTITVTLLKSYSFDKDNVSELYMLGLVAESFDSNHPLPLTSLGNGKFQWSGAMDFATKDDNDEHANKQFKFVTPKGDWNKVYYLVPQGADADGFIQQITPGKYPLEMTTWTDGRTGVDAFFGLTDGAKGNYTILVDVPNMELTLTEGLVAVNEIESAQAVNFDGEVLTIEENGALYDLSGRKAMDLKAGSNVLNGLCKGVYIVTLPGKNIKINL